MIDRERVIKGLECCVNNDKCKACPYEPGIHCTIDIMRDALELLKEYDEMAERYSKILMETTGGRLSKTGYDVSYIMDCICEHYCDGCDVQEERDAMLKAQEPRVLTLDELEGWDGAFMIESRMVHGLVWASWYAEYVSCGENMCRMLDIDAEVDDRLRRAYGYLWRCWTSRPTDEQRKAAAWDDD